MVLNKIQEHGSQDLTSNLKQQGYRIGATDSNLYIKFENINMIIVVFYVDGIIFGSDLQILSVNFSS